MQPRGQVIPPPEAQYWPSYYVPPVQFPVQVPPNQFPVQRHQMQFPVTIPPQEQFRLAVPPQQQFPVTIPPQEQFRLAVPPQQQFPMVVPQPQQFPLPIQSNQELPVQNRPPPRQVVVSYMPIGGVRTKQRRILEREVRLRYRRERAAGTRQTEYHQGYLCERDTNGITKHLSNPELNKIWPTLKFAETWTADIWTEFCSIYHKTRERWGTKFNLKKVNQKFYNFSRIHVGFNSYDWMVKWIATHGVCIICGDELFFWVPYGEANLNKLAVWDHNHDTHKDRKMICSGCNKGIGLLKDNPRILSRALVYLQAEGNYPSGNVDNLGL